MVGAVKVADYDRCSIASLSEIFGVHRNSITKAIREHDVGPSGTERGSPTYALRDVAPVLVPLYVRDWQVQTGDPAMHDPGRMHPKDRKDWFDSENKRMDFEQRRGDLVPIDEYRRHLSGILQALNNSLELLPPMLERKVGLPADAIELIDQQIDDFRSTLIEELRQLMKEDDDDD